MRRILLSSDVLLNEGSAEQQLGGTETAPLPVPPNPDVASRK